MTNFFPHLPLHPNYIAFFGITLLLGIIGGEIARRIPFLPRISGYIFIGFLVGPGGFNIIHHGVLNNARIFVDISLSLILFDLGKHLDFTWIRHDRGLLPTAIAESGLTFVAIFAVLYQWVGLSGLQSALGATIGIATSPAVVMMVANDLSAEGPVTRRTFILTSLNNLLALCIFSLLLPLTQYTHMPSHLLLAHAAYQLIGSAVLGIILFLLTLLIAHLIGKQRENQFVLFVGAVVLTIGLAETLKLSSMLSLFMLGVAARNLDYRHSLMEIDFGWLARLFFILLFVVTGAHLQLQGLWQATGAVIIFVVLRMVTKMGGVLLFFRMSHLRVQQALAIGMALFPMAGVAIGMANSLSYFNPDFGHDLLMIIAASIAILNIIGPIFTQLAFIKTGEGISK